MIKKGDRKKIEDQHSFTVCLVVILLNVHKGRKTGIYLSTQGNHYVVMLLGISSKVLKPTLNKKLYFSFIDHCNHTARREKKARESSLI